MSLQDRIKQIDEENRTIEQDAKKYTDEEIYQILFPRLYQNLIANPIAEQYAKDPALKTITGEFSLGPMGPGRIPASFEVSKNEARFLNNDSDIYNFIVYDTNQTASIFFNDFFKLEKSSFSRKRFSLTSLGKRVYEDLCLAAAEDNVSLSKPKPYYRYEDINNHRTLSPPLDKYFIVKEGLSFHFQYGVNVEYSYKVK